VNTLNRPPNPLGSEPTSDDDPTGVRALLSSLPEPDAMPKDLVERINASLAAEQAQRATSLSGASATPLLASARHRRARLLFAIAGAAAAFVVLAVVGTAMFTADQSTTISSSAGIASSSGAGQDRAGAPQSAPDKAPAAAVPTAPSLVQIGLSATRYTESDFVMQAETLRRSAAAPIQPPAESSGLGPAGTGPGLRECLIAIGAGSAQVVRADVAFYEGQPAVIIVAVTNGVPRAYAVGRACSRTDAAVLRAATQLP
jgi:hypothetical protein